MYARTMLHSPNKFKKYNLKESVNTSKLVITFSIPDSRVHMRGLNSFAYILWIP